ncbi:hypothetical protein Tco_0025501 [Tanacetum coccineum]
MANKEVKSTMREFMTNDQANYYSGITSIMVNGKNAYELKGKFLDDLHNNAFGGTNGEDVVEHIEYFLRIVYPIDLPNENHDKLRVVVFSISLVGGARRPFDEIKGSIDRALWDYWKLGSEEIEPTNEELFDLEETDHDDEQEINLDLLTKDIEGFKTYEDLKDDCVPGQDIASLVVIRMMSSPNHSTSDIEDAFSSMNILNYTSVSSDYFPISSESSSFNSSKNTKDNMIPPVFSPFYNNPCLKDVQAFYTKESTFSSPDNYYSTRCFLTPSPVLPPSLLFDL